jgi:predicted nicotinamide N-methyase
MALYPEKFGLEPVVAFEKGETVGPRILELGAGTGLLSILCRKLLDLYPRNALGSGETGVSRQRHGKGLVVATDFLQSVLDNLKTCVDLNFAPLPDPVDPSSAPNQPTTQGLHIAKLDWTTFPAYMQRQSVLAETSTSTAFDAAGDQQEMAPFVHTPFDLVLASDCVYDPTHAKMLRDVASWVLRLPDERVDGDSGGTFVSPAVYIR